MNESHDGGQMAWAKFRMPTWEQDFSLNHHSIEPFQNGPAPYELPFETFEVWSLLTADLLGDKSLNDYLKHDTYPIPSSSDREGYNVNRDATYYLNGLADFLKVLRTAENYELTINSYLDFGCASGRVLRHFCCQTEIPTLWGSDINGRHIRWLNDYLPRRLRLIHNHSLPTLPLPDQSMDLITAFSVFTHIDTFETAWLAEISRILKPNGLVYLTVQNDASWQFLRQSGPKQVLVERLTAQHPTFAGDLASALPDYRLDYRHTQVGPYRAVVFHSDAYLHRTWGRYFQIEEIRPLDHGVHQSVLIGRKR
jgi:SAM-dependent methyltransferase